MIGALLALALATGPAYTHNPRGTGKPAALKLNFARSDATCLPSGSTFGTAAVTNVRAGTATVDSGLPFRANLATYSQDFDNATAWIAQVFGTGATPVRYPNVVPAPDGTLTADRVIFSAPGGTDQSVFYQASIPPAGTYVMSVYARARSGTQTFYIEAYQAGYIGTTACVVNDQTWARCVTPPMAVANSSIAYYVGLDSNNGQPAIQSADVYLWGAQIEQSPTVSAYVANNGSGVAYAGGIKTCNANEIRLGPQGMLIESATGNLLTYSEQFDNAAWSKLSVNSTGPTVTANAALAPDGSTTADRIDFGATSAGNSQSNVYQGFTAAAVNYTFSVYLKLLPGFGGSATTYLLLLGSGPSTAAACTINDTTWTRCSLTALLTVGAANAVLGPYTYAITNTEPSNQPAISVYSWGAQLEQRATATSYVASVGTNGSRSADVIATTVPTARLPLTSYCVGGTYTMPWNQIDGYLFSTGGAVANTINMAPWSDGKTYWTHRDGTNQYIEIAPTMGLTPWTQHKITGCIKGTASKLYDGAALYTGPGGGPGTGTLGSWAATINIGNNAGATHINGWVRDFFICKMTGSGKCG